MLTRLLSVLAPDLPYFFPDRVQYTPALCLPSPNLTTRSKVAIGVAAMGMMKSEYDVESYSPTATDHTEKHIASALPVYADPTGAVPGESFAIGDSLYARIQRLAGKYSIEQRGIERVPENERTDTNLVKVGTMVYSGSIASRRQLRTDQRGSGSLRTW